MKTREEERKEDMKVGEILRAFPITLAAIYSAIIVCSIVGVFYALGTGVAVLATGLWLSHLYYKLEMRSIKKSVRDK